MDIGSQSIEIRWLEINAKNKHLFACTNDDLDNLYACLNNVWLNQILT